MKPETYHKKLKEKMDEYLPLKEAAKIFGYNPDYIGYLIRKGKIKGKKIYSNTSWQISKQTVIEYCRERKKEVKNLDIGGKYLSLKQAAKISGYASDYIGYLIRVGKIKGRKAPTQVSWLVSKGGIERYQILKNKKRLSRERVGQFPVFVIPSFSRDKVFGIGWRLALATFIIFFLVSGFAPVKFLRSTIGAIFIEETRTVNFYTTLSTGDWQNPQNVQGPPDVGPTGDINSFSEANSAVYKTGPLVLVSERFALGEETQTPSLEPTTEQQEISDQQPTEPELLQEEPSQEESLEAQQEIYEPEIEEPSQEEPIQEEPAPEEPVEEELVDEPSDEQAGLESEQEQSSGPEPELEQEPEQEPEPEPEPEEEQEQGQGEIIDESVQTSQEESGEPSGGEEQGSESQSNQETPVQELQPTKPETPSEGPSEPPISFLENPKGILLGSYKARVKRFFGNLTARAEETPTLEELNNSQFLSAKIKFSFAIGEKESDVLLIENNETENDNTSSEKSISFWDRVKNFFGGLFTRVASIAKAEETVEEEPVQEEPIGEETSEEEPIEEEPVEEPSEDQEEPVGDQEQPLEPEPALEQELEPKPEQEPEPEPEPEEEQLPEEILPNIDTKIIIWWSLDGVNWQVLDTISEYPLSNESSGGYFEYDALFLRSWDDVTNLKIKFEGVVGGETNVVAYLDSVWVEATYQEQEIEEEDKPKITLISLKKDFKGDEEPEFKFKYKKIKKGLLASTGEFLNLTSYWTNINIRAEIKNPEGEILDILPDFAFENNGEFLVKLKKPRELKPGLYTIILTIEDEGIIQTFTQDFSWGVLAINTNKSIYLPSEVAYLQMAALKDDGHTICDANLRLEITSPDGKLANLQVQKSGKCGPDNVTDVPDYFAFYQVGGVGIYQMKLINLDSGHEISDSFEVREGMPFDVERIGPTRIWPKAPYEMNLRIKVNQDFNGQIIETVPLGFSIENIEYRKNNETLNSNFSLLNPSEAQEIHWEVDVNKDDFIELLYTFNAPDISPYLYLLGPLQIGDFREIKQWQIASDSPGLTYTEIAASVFAASASAEWVEYDLFTNKSVPKGAIAEIIIRNANPDLQRKGGVREKGSSINRMTTSFGGLQEAEGGGYVTAEMLVQTDATDGTIEVYAEATADVDFVLMGYFEGCDFTEAIGLAENPGASWEDKDLSGYGVPPNAVVQILMGNYETTENWFAGVRANGSGLERGFVLDEAEGNGYTFVSMLVKADAGSVIEWKGGSSTHIDMWILGWFSAGVDFTEGWTQVTFSGSKIDGVWESRTLTDPPANSIITMAMVHQDSGSETNVGLRVEGGSQARMIQEHEQEGGAGGGFQASVNVDTDKKLEIYSDDSSESLFYYTGYFSEILEVPILNQRSVVWQNDDGDTDGNPLTEGNINNNSTSTSPDTALEMEKGERATLRVQIDNTGVVATTTSYKLQFATTTGPGTCTSTLTWDDVGTSTAIAWSYGLSGINGDYVTSTVTDTSNSCGGSCTGFATGTWHEAVATTSSHELTNDWNTEFGFMIHTANAATGTTYCLKLVDSGSTINYSTSSLGELSIVDSATKKYSKNAVASTSDSDATSSLTYFLDDKGYSDVGTKDDGAHDPITSSSSIPVFLFAKKHTNNIDSIDIEWNGSTTEACSSKAVYLQVYNSTSSSWETFASSTSCSANEDLTLETIITTNPENYYDANNWRYVRVYQATGTQTLTTDYVSIGIPTPDVSQRAFIFENDDGSDVNSNSDMAASNTAVTEIKKGQRLVARFQIDNTGAGDKTSAYKVQYDKDSDEKWTDLAFGGAPSSNSGDSFKDWNKETLSYVTDYIGQYTSIAIGSDGYPVISYYNSSNYTLMVTKCNSADCSASTTNEITYGGDSIGSFTSIAISTDGYPVIAHRDTTDVDTILVTKCSNLDCSNSTTSQISYGIKNIGFSASMAIGTDGYPVISSQNTSDNTLMVTKCNNATCTSYSNNEVTYGTDQIGIYSSIAIGNDGYPVIAYRNNSTNTLMVTKCNNAACSASTSTQIFYGTDNVGFWSSIAIGTDGYPVISHQNWTGTYYSLLVTKCNNASCSNSTTNKIPNALAANVGEFSAIAIGTDGYPIIAHQETAGNDSLMVTKCGSADCSISTTITLHQNTNEGRFVSLTIGTDGYPVISHGKWDGVNHLNLVITKQLPITELQPSWGLSGVSNATLTSSAIGCTSTLTWQDGQWYEATATSSSINLGANKCTELAFMLDTSEATASTTYRLRLVYSDDTTLDSYESYPTLTTVSESQNTLRYSKEAIMTSDSTCGGTATSSYSCNEISYGSGGLGAYISLAIGTDGYPVIAYFNNTTTDTLQVTKCNSADCSTSTTNQISYGSDNVGQQTSLVIGTDGYPVISHMNWTDTDTLMVTKCNNVDCSSSNNTEISYSGDIGFYSSLAIGTDGYPVISCRNNTTTDTLLVIKCNNVDCSSSNITEISYSSDNVGAYSSLAIGTDGYPVIAHRNFSASPDSLMVTKCNNIDCSLSSTTEISYAGDDIGQWASLAIGTDGYPVISHFNLTDSRLLVTKCYDMDCLSSPITNQISYGSDNVGQHTSLAIGTDGYPVISHRNVSYDHLLITKCNNADCSSSTTTDISYGADQVGYNTSLAIGADGYPVVAHQNLTANPDSLIVTKALGLPKTAISYFNKYIKGDNQIKFTRNLWDNATTGALWLEASPAIEDGSTYWMDKAGYTAAGTEDGATTTITSSGGSSTSTPLFVFTDNFAATTTFIAQWIGQSTEHASISKIYLQIFRFGNSSSTTSWFTIASSTTCTANNDCTIQSNTISSNVDDYFYPYYNFNDSTGTSSPEYWTFARVYQAEGSQTLKTDYWSLAPPFVPTINISGYVYSGEGTGPLSSKTIRLKVNAGGDATTSTNGSGYYSFSDVSCWASDIITVYIDNDAATGTTVTVTNSSTNILDMDIYADHIIVRDDNTGSGLTIANMVYWDKDNDTDVQFTATTTGTDTLTVDSPNELYVWSTSAGKFTPIGDVTTHDLEIASASSTYTASGTESITISGSWNNSGTFTAASSTVTFNSTSTEAITTGGSSFYDLTFNSSDGNGVWTFQDAATTTNDLTITAGTASSTYNMYVLGGDVTGNGDLNWTANTFFIYGTGDFGGTTDWTFYHLTFGSGSAGTTTAISTVSATTTVSGNLTITSDHTLAGAKSFTISGNATGDGTINLTDGTFTMVGTGSFGGAGEWTLYNLTLGDGSAGTTTAGSSGTTTISNILTISNNQKLYAGSKAWVLSGAGTPFVISGTFYAETSTFKYTDTTGGGGGDMGPSTAATTSADTGSLGPWQVKSFYANGRYWVWTCDADDTWKHSSSADGSSWVTYSPGECYNGEAVQASVYFDGTYVHYAVLSGSLFTNYLNYRRGIPQSDGTITWSAGEQLIFTGGISDRYGEFNSIGVDSNGYVWISTKHYDSDTIHVFKNATTSGTWTTDCAYSGDLNGDCAYALHGDEGLFRSVTVPLTDGKMYFVYAQQNSAPRGRLWNGNAWADTSEETDVADYAVEAFPGELSLCIHATGDGDDVYFTYLRDTTNQLRFNKRVYGSGWQASDELVQDSVATSVCPVISYNTNTDDSYVFWAGSPTAGHIYYKKRTSGGTWDASPTDWIDETTDGLTYNYQLSTYSKDLGSKIGIAYQTKSSSPYNVRVAALDFGGGGGTTYITATTYYNLELSPSGAGSPTYTLAATTSGTITTLRPNAAGTYQAWSTFGTSTTHWQMTSDQDDDDGVQITNDTISKETEDLDDPSFETYATINKVTVYARCQVTGGGGGPETGRIVTRTYSSDFESTAFNLSDAPTWTDHSVEYTTNPSTTLPWTRDEVINLEIGTRADVLETDETMKCSEYWAEVDWIYPLVTLNYLYIGDGTNAVTVTAATNDPNIDINGNLTINATAILIASDLSTSTFTVAGNWSNSGTFTHSTSTVTFDGSSTSTFSGATTFYNLTSITTSKTLEFATGTSATTTVEGTLTLDGQACGTQIKLRSNQSNEYWYLNALATTSVDYVDVQDSNATGSATSVTATNSTDSGNNVNWSITEDECAGVTIQGIAYQSNESTYISTGPTITLVVNSTSTATTSASTTDGSFSFPEVSSCSEGDTITVYIDGDATYKGTTVTVTNGSTNILDMDIYADHIIVRDDNTGSGLTIANMVYWDKDNDTDVQFTATTTGTDILTVDSPNELYIWSTVAGKFTPVGDVTTHDLEIASASSIYTAGTESITISGSWTNSGSFTAASSTVTFNSTSTETITTGGSSFYDLTFNSSDGNGVWTFQDAATTTNDLTITAGTASSTYNMYVYGGDVTGNGTLNWTGSTFLLGGTGYFGGTTDWTFYHLTLGDGSTGTTTATSTVSATTTVSGNFTITSDHTLAGAKSFTISGNATGDGTINLTDGTFTMVGTGSFGGAGEWTLYNLTLGDGSVGTTTAGSNGTTTASNILTISNNQKLYAGTNKPWVLSGGGTPFVISGTFYAESSTFKYIATADATTTAATYYNLELSPSGGSPTYYMGAGTTTCNNYLTIGDGTNGVIVTADTYDPTLDILGNFTIATSSTFTAPDSGRFSIGGNWLNLGTFNHSNTTVVFDASGTGRIINTGGTGAGKTFFNLTFNSTSGGWTIETNDLTVNNNLNLAYASSSDFSNRTITVEGRFINSVGGGTTTWTGSTLYLNSLKGNSSLEFNATNSQYCDIIDDPSLDVDDLSVDFWFKAESFPAASGKAGLVGRNWEEGFSVMVQDNGLVYLVKTDNNGKQFLTYSFSPQTDRWYYVALTYESGSFKGYLDAQEVVSTTTWTGNIDDDDGQSVQMGSSFSFANFFDGIIDETRVYNRVLSSTEVLEHYRGAFRNETGLIGLWHLSEGAATVINDSSGYGNNGECYNDPSWSTQSPLYPINTKNLGGDLYATLQIGVDTDVRMWDSYAATNTVDSTASLYSMDHDEAGDGTGDNGKLFIWRDYHTRSVDQSDYCSYETDFDGTDISGAPRQCQATINSGDSWTVDSGATLSVRGGGSSSGDISIIGQGASASWDFACLGTCNIQESSWNYPNFNNGTTTVLNTDLNNESVTATGTLNVDWYLGIHVVAGESTSTDIGNATCTISSTSTAEGTIWKMSSGSWGTASTSQWVLTQSNSSATGTNPQPNSDGAIRIREYTATSSTSTYYKYNLDIEAPSGYAVYSYYAKTGKYLSSSLNADSDSDQAISENWQRDNISSLNGTKDYDGLDQPPDNGTWYVGMNSDLQFSVSLISIDLDLLSPNFTDSGSTTLSATTSYSSGFTIRVHMEDTEGRLVTSTLEIIRFPNNNDDPAPWDTICNSSSTNCGFGYTTDDSDLFGGTVNRFTDYNYCGAAVGNQCWAGFATSSLSTDPVADRTSSGSQSNILTLKASVATSQTAETYTGNIYLIATANY